ncbi:tumor necrosis factor receptor type 1-associated DEATH domain protein [Hemicordylus capensis]|uniref:tumor necrosis factor receptor type 1-associated DEATH domain protein n=1 Tax=Hemicordylus capensis TaxID=884348 RepID=UPI0023026B69|nr:tumor necrosis factor receptor type 1-associated DEATH domain protein [Hemicordylus capensis]XP_053126676.1 tumor necrosis factor receptor type 1-associated DEATH domain protein [Hemicordylus capensis]XP_053126677.1 tumor necrosis factor receptor type 1-associated DEATH domain protein [Hemicordylus capensis]XP_053126678.1 tumor necrosis factor receptor type 1-associated DEATH domain protein [Hemicordylus capensis]
MEDRTNEWVGSAYLFVQSTSEKVLLPLLYGNPEQKPNVFKALKLALADSTGSLSGVDMLKVHCSDPHLIIQLKFCQQENCRKFLQSYREGALQDSLQKHLKVSLSMSSLVPIQMELKTDAEKLDAMIQEEEECLKCIYREKPNRLRDEEITALEESLQSLKCCQEISTGDRHLPLNSLPPSYSSLQTPSSQQMPSSLPPGDAFLFQGQQFANRTIAPGDHQKFAKLVSKKWKQVGRSLQVSCRALRDPVIDNLAIEYEREGLYEQAYQLLRKFIDSEGKRATIQRLVVALEENGLISLAEELLGVHQSDQL